MVPGESFLEGFGRFSEVSRMFSTGVSPPVVRWEVSYEAKSVKNKLEIWSGPKFRKMFQTGQGGPPRNPKIQKKNGPKRALGPILGPGSAAALEIYQTFNKSLGGALEDFFFCLALLGPILGPFGAQCEDVGPCP